MTYLSSRHILVAVDFSENSLQALIFSATLAQQLDSRLTVLHVIHDPVATPGYYTKETESDEMFTLEELATKRFEEFLQESQQEYPHLSILKDAETLLVSGIPVPRILEIVDKIKPDQLVMGSLGRTGLAHVLLGSKAEKVAQLCPIPVTIIKKDFPENNETTETEET